jgi:hypothetical protein
MTTGNPSQSPQRHTPAELPRRDRRRAAGIWSAVLGALGLAALAWVWVVSQPGINPPHWARVAGMIWLPVGVIGAPLAGAAGLRGPARTWAVTGIVLAVLTVAGLIVLETTAG